MSTTAAALHAHVRFERFRRAIDDGEGPRPWPHDFYKHARYHVAEVDRWLSDTEGRAA